VLLWLATAAVAILGLINLKIPLISCNPRVAALKELPTSFIPCPRNFMPISKSDPPAASAPWETKQTPSGKKFLPVLAGIALLGLIAWGLWPKPILVETGKVATGPLTVRVSEEGKTRVKNRYVVAAPVAGKMRRVLLKPGDPVIAGETSLTTIEPTAPPLLDPRARVQAEAFISMQEAARKQAMATLDAKKSALTMAEADRDRVRAVTRAGTVSATDRDRAEGDALMRAAEVRATEFSLQVIDYEIARARAALERPNHLQPDNQVEVKSPVSGRVLRVMQESEIVATSGMAILEIGDPSDLEIEAEILSRDAVAIRLGDTVEIALWGGETPLNGRVRRVEPAAFTKISALGVEEQRVIVLCDLIDPQDQAKALGDRFRVEVRVAIWHSDYVLLAPAGALFREGNAWKTYVFQNGQAELTAITAGHSDGRFTEILEGLKAGDEILLHPPDTITDGATVMKH
jgi:HlyD family secretion protein